MLKLFSFAGTGHYQQATYEWGERSLTTSFICQALASWLEPEEIFVVMTPTAERHENWRNLQSAMPKVQALRIPEPGSESALWEIFRTLSEAIKAPLEPPPLCSRRRGKGRTRAREGPSEQAKGWIFGRRRAQQSLLSRPQSGFGSLLSYISRTPLDPS